jgi:dimethylhistidine N-methyltransferase
MLSTGNQTKQSTLVFHDLAVVKDDFASDVSAGLRLPQKQIPPKYFYDKRGSELFDAICTLPEYYLTRADIEIIDNRADEIAAALGRPIQLVEFGSGSSLKVQLLLDALRPEVYMPIDISRDHLLTSAAALSRIFPWLPIHAVCADYTNSLRLPYHRPGVRLAAFFPGSSIGNFEPIDATRFLKSVRNLLDPDGALIIGVDLKKSQELLEAAYNDKQGITAAFNLNLLHRMQKELDAEVRIDCFTHSAHYNPNRGRIEMHLKSRCRQVIHLRGESFAFEVGETIHTENSYKYTVDEFKQLAVQAGFVPLHVWTDTQDLFSLHVMRVCHDRIDA